MELLRPYAESGDDTLPGSNGFRNNDQDLHTYCSRVKQQTKVTLTKVCTALNQL